MVRLAQVHGIVGALDHLRVNSPYGVVVGMSSRGGICILVHPAVDGLPKLMNDADYRAQFDQARHRP